MSITPNTDGPNGTDTDLGQKVADLPGEFSYVLSADGLTLTAAYIDPSGATVTSRVVWSDPHTALERYEASIASFERGVASEWAAAAAAGQPSRSIIQRVNTPLGTIWVALNIGKPTWWRPRAFMGTNRQGRPGISAGFGWGQLAATVRIARPGHA